MPLKEGGSWEKHGFPHGSEPEASDAHAVILDDQRLWRRRPPGYRPVLNVGVRGKRGGGDRESL
jgi:hypothetical protein